MKRIPREWERPRRPFTNLQWIFALLLLCIHASSSKLQGQITNIVFQDDFSDGVIQTNRYKVDAPFFEGGQGTFTAVEADGVLQMTGTVSQQWWAGSTLRIDQVFHASPEQSIAVNVDRVAEAGVGTASRSALWILDGSGTKYVLFADVRGEGGWRFNRKIGEAGDVPTGSGNDIAAFNGGTFDDGQLHKMRVVANGRTVRLFLDGVFGAEVKFPFTNVVFHLGTYARANNDTASTTWDNLQIETIGNATFSTTAITLPSGQTNAGITVRIPPGANATQPIQVRVVSSNPNVFSAVGSVNGVLTLTFPAGATNEQTIAVRATGGTGGGSLTLQSDVGLAAGNNLVVTVIEGPGLRLSDNFSSAVLNTNAWTTNGQGFENGTGNFDIVQANGTLTISGFSTSDFWGGASIRSVNNFIATKDLPLTVEFDRVFMTRNSPVQTESTAARTGVFLTTADRSRYFFLSQNLGETGWSVNLNPGSPTGSGQAIPAFAGLTDTNSHRVRLVADGTNVDVYIDGIFGGRFDFEASSGIFVELGAYARAVDDYVAGSFDNVRIENTLPCITGSPADVSLIVGQPGGLAQLTIPRLLNATRPVSVTLTSRDANVATIGGGTGASRTFTFATGATNLQSFTIDPIGVGTTTIDITTTEGVCIARGIPVTVTAQPVTLLSDLFSGNSINTNNWVIETSLLGVDGALTAGSSVTVQTGRVVMVVTNEFGNGSWPGFELTAAQRFNVSPTTPAVFEVDRSKMEFVLVTGTAAKQRTGVFITDSTGSNYVFFGDYGSHDAVVGGWQYNQVIGTNSDRLLPGAGTAIPAFNQARFNDFGNHRIKVIANGSTLKLYLDDVFGAEVPFPFQTNLSFSFGTFVNDTGNVAVGIFDNVQVLGTGSSPEPGQGKLTSRLLADGSIQITWTGNGVLQVRDHLGEGAAWRDVSPAPTGNQLVIPRGSQAAQGFYRLKQ